MKKLVRWTATYETLIDVPEGADERDEAAMIKIDVPDSTYQSDTWEVDSVKDATLEEIEAHKPD